METTSKERLPKYQRLGMQLIVNFNEQEINSLDEDDKPVIEYRYDTAKVCRTSNRDERIEAMIATRYPTYGAELAAMHKTGVEAGEYAEFRELCKITATESFNA